MSELTLCNYCTLCGIRERAHREGKAVSLRSGGLGTDVFVHPKRVRIPKDPRLGKAYIDGSRYESYFVASMMEIPPRCCC